MRVIGRERVMGRPSTLQYLSQERLRQSINGLVPCSLIASDRVQHTFPYLSTHFFGIRKDALAF